MRNIEIKARILDMDAARRVAQSVATEPVVVQQQIDTYFHCRHGRLKLREIDAHDAQLVWYARADQQGPKGSDYQLVPIADPQSLKNALCAALGIRAVVEKRREIWMVHNVRIHLDEVAGLGHFLEFEAVLGEEDDDAAGLAQVDGLIGQFGLNEHDLLPGSYGDMLE